MHGKLTLIILDTCTLIFDSLSPEKLGAKALKAIEKGEEERELACSNISLWEIAMLINKGRLDPGTNSLAFIRLVLAARLVQVIPINAEIAHLSATHSEFTHHDPADRLIAATALHHKGTLVTCDSRLVKIEGLATIW